MYGIETIKRINAEARASGLDIKAYHENLPPAIDVKTGEAVYLGHRPDGDPVQKHSAGPLYPFVYYQQGEANYIMTGDVTVRVQSYATAEQLVAEARRLKEQNAPVADVTLEEALKRVATINGIVWEPFRRAA